MKLQNATSRDLKVPNNFGEISNSIEMIDIFPFSRRALSLPWSVRPSRDRVTLFVPNYYSILSVYETWNRASPEMD